MKCSQVFSHCRSACSLPLGDLPLSHNQENREVDMRKGFEIVGLMLLSISVVLPAREKPLVLTHATVIDTTGGPVQTDMTVIMRGDRVMQVGKSTNIRVPAGSQVLNATSKFLIPGLWDMNAFWYERAYSPLFIANGVTGV